MRQQITSIAAAYVRMRADKLALLNIFDWSRRCDLLPNALSFHPKCRLKASSMFVERKRVKSAFVVDIQMRIEESIFLDF